MDTITFELAERLMFRLDQRRRAHLAQAAHARARESDEITARSRCCEGFAGGLAAAQRLLAEHFCVPLPRDLQ